MTSPAWNGLLLLLVAAAAAEGLVAVWAATSRAHWFVRALAVWGGVMLLIPVRVYEPALVFTIAGPLTVGWVLIARRKRQREASPEGGQIRYGVRDLMLLMFLVALVIVGLQFNPAVQEFDRQDWLACLMGGTLLSSTVTLAALLIDGTRRLPILIALVAVIVASAWAVPNTSANTKLAWLGQELLSPSLWGVSSKLEEAKRVAFRLTEVALLVTAFVGLPALSARATSRRLRQRARVVLGLGTLLFAVSLGWLYWQMLWPTPLPPAFTGPINHYPRVLTIADALGKTSSTRPETQALYRSLVDEVVELADAPNFVPWDLERDATQHEFVRRIFTVQSLRELCRTLDAESNAAVMAGNYDRASELAAANMRLGLMLNRGGTIVEALVGVAIDGVGVAKLTQMRANLAPNEARAVLAELQRALAEVEDAEAIAYRDLALSERAYGWEARLESISLRLSGKEIPAAQAFGESMRRRSAENLLLQTDLAARLFYHEQGHWPASLEELVPEYLPAVPLDPYSESSQTLRYRAETDGFVLYSVGRDGTDDGGKFGNFQTYFGGGYDYDLDTHSRP